MAPRARPVDETTAKAKAPQPVAAADFPRWVWNIPEYFNIGVACADAHLGTAVAGRVAVIVDDLAGHHELTFAKLAAQTSRFAQVLRKLGIGAGERVLVRLPNCIEYPVIFLGAMKRGALPVPTSTLLTAEEVLYLAQDSGACAMVTDRATWNGMHAAIEAIEALTHVLLCGAGETAPASRITVVDLESALVAVDRWQDPHPTRAEDPAY